MPMQMPLTEILCNAAVVALCVWLIAELRRKELQSRLLGLFCFVTILAAQTAVTTTVAVAHGTERQFFFAWLPFEGLLQVSLPYFVYTAWKLSLEKYRGFHQLCFWLIVTTVTAVLVIFGVTSRSWFSDDPRNWILLWLVSIIRAISFVGAALLALLFFLLRSFAIKPNPVFRKVTLFFFFLLLVEIGRTSLLFFTGNAAHRWTSFISFAVLPVFLLASWRAVERYNPGEEFVLATAAPAGIHRQQLDADLQAMDAALLRLFGNYT